MKLPSSRYAYFRIMVARILKNRLFFIAVFFLGIAVGLFFHKINIFKEKQKTYFSLKRLFSDNAHLVNPLIGVENPEGGDVKLESIKYSIQEYIDRCKQKGDVSDVSVYLRDLNKGTWIGIDEEQNYAAASLLKVPIMLAYLKMAEQDPSILSKETKYETEIKTLPQNIAPQNSAQLGNTYSVDKLLRYMIAYSDNISKDILLKNIDSKLITKLYSDLQIPTPDLTEQEHQISAKDYASFFRVLYNATYLNKDLSEKAIKLLTERDFPDGIVAGVPENITVANKFAERKYAGEGFSLEGAQLHDCGIVYHPKGPYLICIMTKGRDLNTLKGIIKEISKIVYEQEEKTVDLY